MLLAVCMLFSMVSIPALAADNTTGGASETVSTCSASKTDELLNRETNRYEVEIQMPGRKPGIVFLHKKRPPIRQDQQS